MPDDHDSDARFMLAALAEARSAADDDEVPVGAVVVRKGRIIGRGRNAREQLADPTAHAEMLALTAAAAEVRDWRLANCTLYVTLEPCAMCAGAIVLARIRRLVFGPRDAKAGACVSLFSIVNDERLNHQVELTEGILAEECSALMRGFFAAQRAAGKK
jgi:tRNA(adenine34) deaminase